MVVGSVAGGGGGGGAAATTGGSERPPSVSRMKIAASIAPQPPSANCHAPSMKYITAPTIASSAPSRGVYEASESSGFQAKPKIGRMETARPAMISERA